jgi:hypothetical protein
MLRSLQSLTAIFLSLTLPLAAAPVAVGDAYSVNEDSTLQTSEVLLFSSTFDPVNIAAGQWQYLDKLKNNQAGQTPDDYPLDGSGRNWKALDYDPASSAVGPWTVGQMPLVGGSIDAVSGAVPVLQGANSTSSTVTTYLFRKVVNVDASTAAIANWTLRAVADDGAVFYLNGVEIGRLNMDSATYQPPGAITTLTGPAASGNEATYTDIAVNLAGNLVAGSNILAVEVHQTYSGGTYGSSDIGLDLSLTPGGGSSDGFTYADNTFGTSVNDAYATGNVVSNFGNPGTSLNVALIRPTFFASRNCSGGWSRTFNMPIAGTLRIQLDARLRMIGGFESTEFGQAILAVDGVRYGPVGTAPSLSLIQTFGDNGAATSEIPSTWQSFTIDIPGLAAGDHTITLGSFCNRPTDANEISQVYFDNVVATVLGSGAGVLANDTGGAVSAAVVSGPTNGTLNFSQLGTFTYTPNANFSGADSFTYTASDGVSNSNTATVSLTVNPVNDAPTGTADSYETIRDVTLNVPVGTGVLVNDSDIDTPAGNLTAVLAANAVNGVVTLNANGSFSYVPAAGFAGADNFSYRVSDGTAQSALVNVNLNVIGRSVPLGVGDSYTMVRNSTLNVSATSTGSVTEDVLPYLSAGWKYLDNGSNQGTAWRGVGFDDSTWASGPAELGYGNGDEATVVGFGPDSNNKYITTYFRKVINVADVHRVTNVELSLKYDDAGIVYINGTQVLITAGLVANPAHTAIATASGGNNAFATANLSLPASMLVEGPNTIAVEIHQNSITSSDISMDLRVRVTKTVYAGVLANDTDQDNDPLTAVLVTPPAGGTFALSANGTFTYTPVAGFTGAVNFVYRAADAMDVSANTTATINVIAGPNQGPLAVGESYNATEDTTLIVPSSIGVLANDTDGEGDAFSAELVSGMAPAGAGVVTLNANGSFEYIPATNFAGLATFTYLGRDSQGASSQVATVSINVANVNDAPIAAANTYATDPGVTLSVSSPGLLDNDSDPDGDPLSAVLVTGVSPSSAGVLTFGTGGAFTFVPTVGFSGTATFVYRAADASLSSANTNVSIRINARPVPSDDTYVGAEDVVLSIGAPGVLADDSDPDGDPLTALLVAPPSPSHGTVVLNANGSFVFTPAADYSGPASFTYKVNDGFRDSTQTANVTLNIVSSNDAPTGVSDFYVTPVGVPLTVPVTGGVLKNDEDPELDVLTVASFTQPQNGTVAMQTNGAFVYTPALGFTGTDTFTYRSVDASAQSDVTSVSIFVGSPKQVVINEIMYHPVSDVDLEEYIELFNSGTGSVNLKGWKLSKGVNYVFPDITIPAGGHLVVAADVTAFNAGYGGAPLVVGGWTGTLANSGEAVRLQYPDSNADDGFSEADIVEYSKEGDWGLRRPFVSQTETGWEWESRADGAGDSLELINPALDNSNGQNWTKREVLDSGNRRTPGAANTDIALAPALNSAPLISNVRHKPEIPQPGQSVNVTAKFTDELSTGITGRVFWRTWVPNQDVVAVPAGNFAQLVMSDDGLHGDGAANDGVFGATIPTQAVNTIVEFYVQATDSGARVRTWPAPTNATGTQGANCHFQFDDEVWTGRHPMYRLIANGSDEYEFNPSRWAQASDAAINVTFISKQGDDVDVHYLSSIRVRGAGSRSNVPRNWKIEWRADDRFNDQRKGNLNIAFPYAQYLGAQLMKQANIVYEGATPVQVRLNKTNHATTSANSVKYGYGMYVHMQPNSDSTYLDENFSNDSGGNIYKKVRPHQNFLARATGTGAPDVAQYLAQGWTKETNTNANNWSDIHQFLTAFTVPNYSMASIEPYMDIDQWCRVLAFTAIVNDTETNITNGSSDDFSIYFGERDPRVKLLAHDYDTILNMGDTATVATDGIYQPILTTGSGSLSNSETLSAFNPFFADPVINQRYKAQIIDLLNTVFLPANFDAFVDAQLGDWGTNATLALPATTRTAIKTYLAQRRTHILGLLNGSFSAACSLSQANGYFTTTSATTTGLSGTVDSTKTRKVTVNGVAVTLNNYNGGGAGSGVWSAGSAVALIPGINQVVVRALGKDDVLLASQTFDIVFDDSSVQSVSSPITASTVWTAAAGPYRVTSSIAVESTLSIQPGATVYVDPGVEIHVSSNGRILAEGTANLPVRFARTPSASGTWNGIVLTGATSESRFIHTIFSGNGSAAITAQSGSRLLVDFASFRATTVPFLVLNGSSFIVSNSSFPDSTAAMQPVSGNGALAGGQAIFQDCVFGKALGANAALTFSNLQRPGTILQLIGNTFNGSEADLVLLNGCDAWIEGNTFLHAHRNSAALSASAISGGASGPLKSRVTLIRNRIYDCDHAVTMREGNSFAAIQNTIARITHAGGTDTASAVFNFAHAAETPGAGGIVEANIITGADSLVRNYNDAITFLNFDNNILPVAWPGSGADNVVSDPLLNLSLITTPATASASLVNSAFVPQANSPALLRGTLGVVDRGALIPSGILAGGAPVAATPLGTLQLIFGPSGGFGTFSEYGYTHYQASLDNGPFGPPTPVSTALSLTGLAPGVHTVSIIGKNDAGEWQSTPTVVSWAIDPSAVTVRINEILASNVGAYPVGSTRPDIVELHNYGTLPVNLANFSVSDNPELPRKFVFPANTIIPAGGYLVLLGNAPDANPGIHIGFGLDADGDAFALYPPNAIIGADPVDSIAFGIQIPDYSIGRTGPAGVWTLTNPTMLAPNTAVVLGAGTNLKINEWCGSNDFVVSSDFLELFNPGNFPVAIGGMMLSADLQVDAQHTIHPLSYITAGGFVRFIADGDTAAGVHHLSWKISKLRESMRLLSAANVVVDQVVSGPQRADVSEGRTTDGSTALSYFTLPTPGYSNNTALAAQQEILENLRISELMYNPSGGTNAPEFIELQNTSTVLTLNIGGVRFTNGIDYTFPAGTTLTPGQFIILTSNPTAFLTRYGFGAFNGIAYSGKLADGGERIRLEIDGFQLGILDFTYSSAWYPGANGTGASIEIINPLAPRADWDLAGSWRLTAPNPGQNGAFGVIAGDDLDVTLPGTAALGGILSYGTQNPASVALAWTKVSGPGTVSFSAPGQLETTATFSLPGNYVIQLAATGTATVTDTLAIYVQENYTTWASRAIGSNPLTNGMTADADNDGIVNLLEYAFGTPQPGPNPALLQPFETAGLLTVNYSRSSTADVTFAVEVADSLAGPWTSATIIANMNSDNGVTQAWTAYDTRPIQESQRRFLRVRVVAGEVQ